MVGFSLTKEQLLQQQLYRKFAETEVKPKAAEMDEAEKYDVSIMDKMAKYGMLGIPFPKEDGGSGASVLSYALCIEELAKVDASTATACSVHTSLCTTLIGTFGTPEQKEKYYRPLAGGKKYGCFGLTEPNAGSDAAGQQTTAVKEGDHYVLNGSKIFITNSGFSDIFVVFAMTDKSKGTKGISAFILEKGMPGFTVGNDIPRMGIRAASNCELAFENVIIPEENRIGKEGEGFKIAMATLDGGRIGVAAIALGIAQGAINETIKYVGERKQFGKRIAQFQNTQFKLAELQAKVDAARLLVWRAACAKDNHEPISTYAAMAKLVCSDVANETTRTCVQLFGGYGYSREYPIERMMRDAKITQIYEETHFDVLGPDIYVPRHRDHQSPLFKTAITVPQLENELNEYQYYQKNPTKFVRRLKFHAFKNMLCSKSRVINYLYSKMRGKDILDYRKRYLDVGLQIIIMKQLLKIEFLRLLGLMMCMFGIAAMMKWIRLWRGIKSLILMICKSQRKNHEILRQLIKSKQDAVKSQNVCLRHIVITM